MQRKISNQLCACGCGEYTLIGTSGPRRGKPNKYLKNHTSKGKNNPNWKCGKVKNNGYVLIYKPDHPYSKKDGYIKRSHLVVEKVIGNFLKPPTCVHHVDGDKQNDFPNNLVVCENGGYHSFLHGRQRALEVCGHANWYACVICGEYDDPNNMKKYGRRHVHGACCRSYANDRYAKNKDKINKKRREQYAEKNARV